MYSPLDFTANDCVPVTPDDNNPLPSGTCWSLLIANAGAIKVITGKGNTRTLTVPAGIFNCRVSKVFATGTTATGISAYYF